MKKKLLQTCLFLTLFGLLLITPIGRVLASAEGNLQVINLAGTTVNYTYDQLMAMPESTVSADLYCYGNLVTSGNWGGVSLSYLLQQAGLDPAVASVDFLAQDGYAVNIPLQEAMQSDVIIAYENDGSPLPETLRLVVPGANGNIWIAMITTITMSTSVVSVSQSGNTGATPPLDGTQTPTNSTGQSSTQQQEPVQIQPTTPKNETSTEPVAPPANVTQPEQKASNPPETSLGGLGFPVAVVYGIALGATVALVAVGYFIHKDRRGKGKLAVVS
jgi:DMSO/TMAO reductase YedYZ molybdopterin-dependent catalytic subunit